MSDAPASNRILLVFAGSVVVLLGIALMATRTGRTATASTPPVVVENGASVPAPADRGPPALPSMVVFRDGKPFDLAGPRAKPALLHLWATWCGPCRDELPLILDYGRGGAVEVIALSVDDEWPSVQAYFGATIPVEVAWDPKIVVEPTMGVRSLPTTFLIDTNGRLRRTFVGAQDWRSPELRAAVTAALR